MDARRNPKTERQPCFFGDTYDLLVFLLLRLVGLSFRHCSMSLFLFVVSMFYRFFVKFGSKIALPRMGRHKPMSSRSFWFLKKPSVPCFVVVFSTNTRENVRNDRNLSFARTVFVLQSSEHASVLKTLTLIYERRPTVGFVSPKNKRAKRVGFNAFSAKDAEEKN